MKKLFYILSILLILFSLASCSNEKLNDKSSSLDNDTTKVSSEKDKNESTSTTENKDEIDFKEDAKNNKYPNASFIDNIENYVEDVKYEDIKFFQEHDYSQYRFDIETVESDEYNNGNYTGEVRTYYNIKSDEGDFAGIRIRVPRLKGEPEIVKKINNEILDIINSIESTDGLYWMSFDYDSYIYNDVLSLRVVSEIDWLGDGYGDHLEKSYNFDISSGKLKLLSNQQMLDKLGFNSNTIKEFLKLYKPACIENYIYRSGNELGSIILDCNDFDDELENNKLNIYKNPNDDNYTLYLGRILVADAYDCEVPIFVKFTLADSVLKMALLSPFEDAVALVCRGVEPDDIPLTGIDNQPTILHKLNESTHGEPVYISLYQDNNTRLNLFDFENYGDYSMFEGADAVSGNIIPKNIKIPYDKEAMNIYLVYLDIAYESEDSNYIVVNTEGEYKCVSELWIDKTNSPRLIYMYSTLDLGRYVYINDDEQILTLKFLDEFKFIVEAEDGMSEQINFPVTKGRYMSDYNYFYLYPCDEDIQNGAADYYVFRKNEHKIYHIQQIFNSNDLFDCLKFELIWNN